MCSSDGEAYEPYFERFRTARKAAKCYECQLPIPPGTRYLESRGYLDGWDRFARHVECDRLSSLIYVEYCGGARGGMWLFGGMLEEIDEYEEEALPLDEDGEEVGSVECVLERETGRPLYGPGTLHGALDQVRARYAPV